MKWLLRFGEAMERTNWTLGVLFAITALVMGIMFATIEVSIRFPVVGYTILAVIGVAIGCTFVYSFYRVYKEME